MFMRSSSSDPSRHVRVADIAASAGVSPRAVSKVLFPTSSNNTRVGREATERIRQIAEEMGYVPNFNARQLAGKTSKIIGAIIDSHAPHSHYSLLMHLETCAMETDHRILIGRMHNNITAISQYLQDFASRRVEGIFVLSHDYPWLKKELEKVYGQMKNIIFLGEPVIPWSNWVGIDIEDGVGQLVRHLMNQGKKSIALFQPKIGAAAVDARVRGFDAALKGLGTPKAAYPKWLFSTRDGSPTQEDIRKAMDELLDAHPNVDGIIALNDTVAAYVLQYLHNRGIRIPEQIAVTGFDNLEISQAAYPSLTSIDTLESVVATKAMELFLSSQSSEISGPRSISIKPKLIERDSSVVKSARSG